MKRIIFLLGSQLFFSFIIIAQDIDVLHYRYEIELNDKNDTIYGSAWITVIRNTTEPLVFDLKEIVNSNGKGMLVTKVDIDDPSNSTHAFKQDKAKITIPIIKGIKGDTLLIQIYYKGIPDDGLIISKNRHGDRTFFADNWPNRAHHWIPCIDRPDDKASFEFIVTAPSHYSVISNGLKVEERDLGKGNKLTHWREDTPQPTKVMVIGVARFATKTFADSPKDIPVSAWVYPQDSTKGFYDYALAPEILKFFSNYIAPYPYKKLANVQSKTIFGGMENASAIFYAESSVTGDRSSEDLIAHEIAHQWFGDAASEKSFEHVWLSEGFATYFTNLYWEAKYGKEAMIKRLQKDREEVISFAKKSTHAVVDSTKDLMSLLNSNSYQKGGWVLHMLRSEVGDTTFQKIIQAYYNHYKGSNADTRDFGAVAEKVSGKELTPFFNQWLYRPGIPRLSFKKTKTAKGIELTVTQLQKELYEFKLPVSVETAATKEKILHLHIAERSRSVVLTQEDRVKLKIDPGCTLLFEEIK
jgi:aminopeptidase N